MPTRNMGNTLEKWEIAIIKAMIQSKPPKNDQDILAYFRVHPGLSTTALSPKSARS